MDIIIKNKKLKRKIKNVAVAANQTIKSQFKYYFY